MLKRVLSLCFLLLCQQAFASSPLKGDGLSADRQDCDGSLRIYATYLNWDAGFSNCHHMPYKVLRRGRNGAGAYQLTLNKKACFFSVLEVKWDDYTGWTAYGYPSVASWRKPGNETGPVFECHMY